MKDAILKHERLTETFFSIITSQTLNINMKLSVYLSIKGMKMRK